MLHSSPLKYTQLLNRDWRVLISVYLKWWMLLLVIDRTSRELRLGYILKYLRRRDKLNEKIRGLWNIIKKWTNLVFGRLFTLSAQPPQTILDKEQWHPEQCLVDMLTMHWQWLNKLFTLRTVVGICHSHQDMDDEDRCEDHLGSGWSHPDDLMWSSWCLHVSCVRC